jgi:hypothetical protein
MTKLGWRDGFYGRTRGDLNVRILWKLRSSALKMSSGGWRKSSTSCGKAICKLWESPLQAVGDKRPLAMTSRQSMIWYLSAVALYTPSPVLRPKQVM